MSCIKLDSLINSQSSLQSRRMVVNIDRVDIASRMNSFFIVSLSHLLLSHLGLLHLIQSSNGLITIQASDRTRQNRQSQPIALVAT